MAGLVEQLEDARKVKRLVKRDVIRVITPGTVTTPGLLPERRNNYLVAVAPAGDKYGIAFADVSTGEFSLAEIPVDSLLEGSLVGVVYLALAPFTHTPRPLPLVAFWLAAAGGLAVARLSARLVRLDASMPVLVVLDATGRTIATQDTGALEKGDGTQADDPAKVLTMLRQWAGP